MPLMLAKNGSIDEMQLCDFFKIKLDVNIYTSLFTVNGSMIGNKKKLNYGKLERNKQSVRCIIYSSYITHCQRIDYEQHCATDTQYQSCTRVQILGPDPRKS